MNTSKDTIPPHHTPTQAPSALSALLRDQTSAAHAKAESHGVQGALIRATISRRQLAAYLTQMHAIWSALDAAVSTAAQRDPRIRTMVAPYHPHAPRVAADLHSLGENNTPVVPETQSFVDNITRLGNSSSPAVVGMWYVLEGSHNGGQFIAKALARSAAAEGLGALRSFDAHGPDQRPRWAAWKAALDASTFTEPERREMVEAAIAAFDGMEQMMHGLSRDPAWSA